MNRIFGFPSTYDVGISYSISELAPTLSKKIEKGREIKEGEFYPLKRFEEEKKEIQYKEFSEKTKEEFISPFTFEVSAPALSHIEEKLILKPHTYLAEPTIPITKRIKQVFEKPMEEIIDTKSMEIIKKLTIQNIIVEKVELYRKELNEILVEISRGENLTESDLRIISQMMEDYEDISKIGYQEKFLTDSVEEVLAQLARNIVQISERRILYDREKKALSMITELIQKYYENDLRKKLQEYFGPEKAKKLDKIAIPR